MTALLAVMLWVSVSVNVALSLALSKRADMEAERSGWRDLALIRQRDLAEAVARAELAESLIVDDLMKEANRLTGGEA